MQLETGKNLPLPSYMTEGAAGADIYAAEDVYLNQGSYTLVGTGMAIEIPRGYEAQIRARSGLAAKYGIGLVNGVGTIDADYRGEIKVIMMNWGEQPFEIKRGTRIAQLVIQKIEQVTFEYKERLSATQRDEGGFGHTGI